MKGITNRKTRQEKWCQEVRVFIVLATSVIVASVNRLVACVFEPTKLQVRQRRGQRMVEHASGLNDAHPSDTHAKEEQVKDRPRESDSLDFSPVGFVVLVIQQKHIEIEGCNQPTSRPQETIGWQVPVLLSCRALSWIHRLNDPRLFRNHSWSSSVPVFICYHHLLLISSVFVLCSSFYSIEDYCDSSGDLLFLFIFDESPVPFWWTVWPPWRNGRWTNEPAKEDLKIRFHKDNLRLLSRFPDLFVTLRILSCIFRKQGTGWQWRYSLNGYCQLRHLQKTLMDNRMKTHTVALLFPSHILSSKCISSGTVKEESQKGQC